MKFGLMIDTGNVKHINAIPQQDGRLLMEISSEFSGVHVVRDMAEFVVESSCGCIYLQVTQAPFSCTFFSNRASRPSSLMTENFPCIPAVSLMSNQHVKIALSKMKTSTVVASCVRGESDPMRRQCIPSSIHPWAKPRIRIDTL